MSVGKKLNKKDLLSSNLATKKDYCTQLLYNSTKSNTFNMQKLINKSFKLSEKEIYFLSILKEKYHVNYPLPKG